ncbi:MAG TPA: YqcC family protein [Polyangia bacterium]
MKKKPAGKIAAQEVQRSLQRVIVAMKEADLWNISRPKDEAFTDMGAFGQQTMAFAQWLRWVFIPNVEALVASQGPWPASSSVAVIATREGDTDAGIQSLVESLAEFDGLFDR